MAPRVSHSDISIDVAEITKAQCQKMTTIIDATEKYDIYNFEDYYSPDFGATYLGGLYDFHDLKELKKDLVNNGFEVTPFECPKNCTEVVYFKVMKPQTDSEADDSDSS